MCIYHNVCVCHFIQKMAWIYQSNTFFSFSLPLFPSLPSLPKAFTLEHKKLFFDWMRQCQQTLRVITPKKMRSARKWVLHYMPPPCCTVWPACHIPIALFDLHATSLLHWLTYIGREGVTHVLVHAQSSMWPAVQPSLPVSQCDSICQYTLLVWVDSCSHLPGKEWRSRMGHLFHLSMGHFLWCVTGYFDL